MKEFFSNVAKACSNAFGSFDFIDALEIILFVIVFYYVFKILKNSNAKGVIAVFILLTMLFSSCTVFTWKEEMDIAIIACFSHDSAMMGSL